MRISDWSSDVCSSDLCPRSSRDSANERQDMTGITGIGFAPLVPWQAVAIIAALALALLVFGVVRGARGSIIRSVAVAILAAALLNPPLESESRRSEERSGGQEWVSTCRFGWGP